MECCSLRRSELVMQNNVVRHLLEAFFCHKIQDRNECTLLRSVMLRTFNSGRLTHRQRLLIEKRLNPIISRRACSKTVKQRNSMWLLEAGW